MFIRHRDSGGGGPPRRGGGGGAGLDVARKLPSCAAIKLARFLSSKTKQRRRCALYVTTTKLRVRRPLHLGSLATRAPVVPLPRYRGGGKWRRFSARRIGVREIDFANDRTFSLCASLYSFFPVSFSQFVISSLKKGEGARSPTGAPPRFLHRRTNATAQSQAALPGTWLRNGRYPSPPVPV
jgi:hypothetical protein